MKRYVYLFFCLCALAPMFARNQFVSTVGDDSQDGFSWLTAKYTIQTAIDAAAEGDTVFVAEGVYNQSLKLKKAVHILGGYSAATGEYNTEAFLTILDGTSLNTPLVNQSAVLSQATYVSGLVLQNANHTANGGAVVLKTNGVLTHCTIRNCYTTGSGGALYNAKGTVTNCIIELCEALGAGGAVHNMGGVVENTIIRGCKGNYAAIRNESDGIVRNCLIHNNEPSGSAWPNSGGIYNPSGVVYNNTLVCNYGSQYAGIHSDNIAYNNLLWNNHSEEGFQDPANFVSGP